MITLICTKCKATLEMDDAFAGGVCRCQYCGTIQTVPSHLKHAARGAAVGAAGGKALYSTKAAAGAGLPSSGLDELANVVASSGLASGLANRTATRPVDYAVTETGKSASRTPLIVGVGITIAVLLGLVVYLLVSRPSNPTPAPNANTNTGPGPVPTASQSQRERMPTPHFLDIPIGGDRVVYLLDRGQSARDVLDPLKAALLESLDSLGANRDFQVMFWTVPWGTPNEKPNPSEFAYPKGTFAKANKDRIEACRVAFEDLTASGRTDIGPVFQEAMKRDPQVVIIATAKGINLESKMIEQLEKAKGTRSVVVHTIDLTSSADGKEILSEIARRFGGEFKHVDPTTLRSR